MRSADTREKDSGPVVDFLTEEEWRAAYEAVAAELALAVQRGDIEFNSGSHAWTKTRSELAVLIANAVIQAYRITADDNREDIAEVIPVERIE